MKLRFLFWTVSRGLLWQWHEGSCVATYSRLSVTPLTRWHPGSISWLSGAYDLLLLISLSFDLGHVPQDLEHILKDYKNQTVLCNWGRSWRSMEVNKGKRFSVQAQGSYSQVNPSFSVANLQLCTSVSEIPVPGGFGFNSYSWPRGMWDTDNLQRVMPVSLSGAGIGKAFYVTEDKIPAFSAMPCAD